MSGRRIFSTAVVVSALMTAIFLAAAPARGQQYDEKLFDGLKYRLIGPYRGGRSITAVGVPSEPNTYYFGAVSGGVWKTTNGGMTWTPLFDKEPVSSIGSVAVADSDPNILYVGTGEACIRGNISHGDGVYKSFDGGKTWTNIGLRDTRAIAKILIHPTNPDIVYVAALGHPYGHNTERGVFRSTDGGKNWTKVLYHDDRTGAMDIDFDPTNPHILFAALWEAGRTPWSLTSGGPGSGIYKSIDDGTTWNHLEGNGLPAGLMGKIGISVSGANPNRVYAIIEAKEEAGGFYSSNDGGEHWTHVTDDHRLRQRPWYYTHVTADPKSADTVYVMNTALLRSTDGGHTWTRIPGPHGDHHHLWIDPKNPKRMINANDGGATISVDGGATWSREDNQPTAQFYHVTTDTRFPYNVFGAQQDNSPIGIASRSDFGAIGRAEWNPIGGGEAGYIAVSAADPDITYAGDYWGIVIRTDKRTMQGQNVMVWPDDVDGHSAAEVKYRFNWTEPIVISPHDPHVLYMAGNILFKSTDDGMSWTPISPDLTRNDKSKQQRSGGPITDENISVETYDVIFTFAESPVQKDLLWVGTDDGQVQLSRDGGKNWSNVTPRELPEWSMVSLLDASAHDAGTAYIAVDRHKLDDLHPYIYKTHDFGKTWTKITSGLADSTFVHVVREDPARKGLLYAGTETGIYVSFDYGARWQPLQLNLPTTPVHDMVIKDNDLVVATHGRAFWILDDVTPLRQLTDDVAKQDLYLYSPEPAYRFRAERSRGSFLAENPPDGAVIDYYLKTDQKDEVTLDILDASGSGIRHFSSKKKQVEGTAPAQTSAEEEDKDRLPSTAGMHRFVWNLRYEMPKLVPNPIWDMGSPHGRMALPSTYQAKLTVGGKSYTAPVEVKLDPRIHTSTDDLAKQFDLVGKIDEVLSREQTAVIGMRSLRAQLAALRKRVEGDSAAADVAAASDSLDKKIAPTEAELIEVLVKTNQDMCNYPTKLANKLAYLENVVDSADAAPTKQSYEFFEELRTKTEAELATWKEIVDHDLAELNAKIQKDNIPAVGLAAGDKK